MNPSFSIPHFPDAPEPERCLPAIIWGTQGSVTAYTDRDGYRLGVVISPILGHGWQVIGLITPLFSAELSPAEALNQVLAQHSHQNLGPYDSLDDARSGAVEFLRMAPLPDPSCGCPTTQSALEAALKGTS